MVESRKSPSGNRKTVIKLGGGGGIIGAVVLLGGALVTAVLASAFAVRHKRRSSGEDSSHEINEKSDNSKGEEVELEDDSIVVISDQSSKLDKKTKVEGDAENDAVSDYSFVIVNEEFPLLAAKSDDHSKEGENILAERESDDHDGDGEIDTTSNEEDVEVKEMQPRLEVKSHDQENNSVEEVQIDQTIEFKGFSYGHGEINEEKCEEKTILPLFEGHAIQQDNLVNDSEDVPLPTDSAEEHKQFHQPEEAKQNHQLDDPTQVRGENVQLTKKNIMNEDGPNGEVKGVENGGSKSNWEALWQAESTNESSSMAAHQVKLMKYEVGGKIEEDRVHDNGLINNDESLNLSTRRVMIWVICVVSSFSCSWFFDLSFAMLGLFLFLTVFLSEIYGYSVVNRRNDYVLRREAVAKNKIIKR